MKSLLLILLWLTNSYNSNASSSERIPVVSPSPDSAFLALRQQYDQAVAAQNMSAAGKCLQEMGKICYTLGHYAKSLEYYADPEKGNEELSVFGKTGFLEDHEGISRYKDSYKDGYILVSDQGASKFQIFSRAGVNHELVKIVKVAATHSDGSDMVNTPLNETFKHGLFVVMSDDKTFHYYRWEDLGLMDKKR